MDGALNLYQFEYKNSREVPFIETSTLKIWHINGYFITISLWKLKVCEYRGNNLTWKAWFHGIFVTYYTAMYNCRNIEMLYDTRKRSTDYVIYVYQDWYWFVDWVRVVWCFTTRHRLLLAITPTPHPRLVGNKLFINCHTSTKLLLINHIAILRLSPILVIYIDFVD